MLDGFGRCLELYVDNPGMTKTKDSGHALLKRDKTVFMKRPLVARLLAYAAVDIQGACALYRELWAKADLSATDQANLREGCRRYLGFHRDKACRTYDKYELNPFVPWGVLDLPAYKHVASYGSRLTQCAGCKRRLPSDIFPVMRSALSPQKCPVCRRVDVRARSGGSRRY